MKKIIIKLSSFQKAVVKKLNNFRLMAVILGSISAVVGAVSLGLLFIYYFAGDVSPTTQSRQPSFTSLGSSGRILGMVFFLFCVFALILSIVIVYNLLPYIKNKEKVTPKKSPLIMAVVNGGFQVVIIVFSILAIVLETPNTLALYVVTIIINIITCAANMLCLIPFLKCVFYQPAIGSRLCPKKQAEQEAK